MRILFTCLALLALCEARADLVITEVMAKSSHSTITIDGDWWELTNTGTSTVNLNGYTWDDTPEVPANISTFPNVTIQPGESIIILAEDAANVSTWMNTWGLTSTLVVAKDQMNPGDPTAEKFSGLNATGDEVNLFNPVGDLVAHVEFGASTTGTSFAFQRDGTPVYGLLSAIGRQGAYSSTQPSPDIASPGDAYVHFNSAPTIYANSSYSYTITAANPAGVTPVISALSIPEFLTFTSGGSGTANLSNNRSLTLADAGNYEVQLSATSGTTSTIQEYILTVLNPSPTVILNEYNAVAFDKFLNGGTATSDDDGGDLSTDSHFGRVIGNGGQWVEFAVVGNGGPELLDLRGWKIEIGKNPGTGFVVQNTLVLSNHADWQFVPSGTILTLINRTTAQGGLDSGFAIRDRRSTVGDTWTNIWMGDPSYLTYTDFATNGYNVTSGVVGNITIDNNGTQFRVKNASNQIVFGPAGEGVAPLSGTNSKEVLELENHPTPLVSPIIATNSTTQGYGDGSADSTFGSPNTWSIDTTPVSQSFTPYIADGFTRWTEGYALTGNNTLRTADPDNDGRNNLNEYAFGGNPTIKDAAYPSGPITAGELISWNYVRRSSDPALDFSYESSINLIGWSPIPETSTDSGPFAGNSEFSRVSVQFSRPLPTPAKWFLRAKAD